MNQWGKSKIAFKKTSTILIALIAAAITLSIATSGALIALSSSQTVPSGGTLTPVQSSINLGIYANSACTQNASFVDWGTLKPGDNTTKTVWIKNLGNANATLSVSATNWSPPNAYPDISLSWNKEGRALAPQRGNSSDVNTFGFRVHRQQHNRFQLQHKNNRHSINQHPNLFFVGKSLKRSFT